MMLKVFGGKSPFFMFIYCNTFDLVYFLFCFVFFFWFLDGLLFDFVL